MYTNIAMSSIQIVEVGPRDGLQNEPDIVSTADKLEMIGRMIDAGARRLEVASFVHPQRVPQMADAEAVIAGLPDRKDVSYIGLTLNKRGVLRALATKEGGRRGVDEIGCVIVATDTFGQKNQGQTVAEGIAEASEMIRFAKENGLIAQVTISAAFGCPFEGDVPAQRIVDIARAVLEAGPAEIALRAHFHNTRGTGIANAWAAIQAGVSVLDASLGGLGGCPFAPKATGHIATEELIYLAERSGLDHGMNLDAAIAANRWMAGIPGRELPSL